MTPEEKWQAWNDNLTYDMRSRNDPMNSSRIPWFVQNPWNAQVPEEYLNQYGNDYEGIVAAQKAAWEQHTGLRYDPTAAYNDIDYLGRRMAKGVLLTPEAWETNLGFPPTEQIHFVGNRPSPEPVYQPSAAGKDPLPTGISMTPGSPPFQMPDNFKPTSMPPVDLGPSEPVSPGPDRNPRPSTGPAPSNPRPAPAAPKAQKQAAPNVQQNFARKKPARPAAKVAGPGSSGLQVPFKRR